MADESTPATPQTAVEAPAAAAPASVSDVTTWAKHEAAKIDAAILTEKPATTTPDTTDQSAATDAGASEPTGTEPEAEKLSRRQRDEQRRNEIRAEVEAEIATRTQRESAERAQRQQQQDAEQTLLNTIARAKAGDYEASMQLASVTESTLITQPKQAQREQQVQQAARDAVLNDIAKDFEPAVRAIEGIGDEDFGKLKSAPTSGEFAKAAIDIGRKLERSALESKIALLEAENKALKGTNASRGPSPLHANGTNGRGGSIPSGSGMRAIAAQVAAEMGVSL